MTISYKNGSDLLNWLMVRRIINKMKKGYSPVILIDGEPNSGKTVLGALICQEIYDHFHKDLWDPAKYTFWDMARLSKELRTIKKTPILIPEAGYELAFDKWTSPHNRFYDIIIQTQRVLGNCYIKNLPVKMDLAKRHRRKTHYRVWVKKHGFCVWYDLQKKSLNKKNEEGVRMGTFQGYSHKDLRCFQEMKRLDEENKALILDKVEKEFMEKETLGILKRKKYKHKCGVCGYEWRSSKEKPRTCANYDCRKRLIFS